MTVGLMEGVHRHRPVQEAHLQQIYLAQSTRTTIFFLRNPKAEGLEQLGNACMLGRFGSVLVRFLGLAIHFHLIHTQDHRIVSN